MTYFKTTLLLLASAIAFSATAGNPNSVPEFCGQTSNTAMGAFLQWDCSNINAPSIAALETSIKETHTVSYSKDSDFKIYSSNQAKPFSAWIFNGNKAAHYRAIFQDNVWKGVGVTTYCSDTPSACATFEALSASAIPRPLVFKLGPPAPEAPPIIK